ncbi:MAG: 7-cyano-7-deazaguanine synthase QueC [Deltaproteobacteria bacterium]|nr:MAG: 7-cyano-7-deazaguanine synthase QueC [Deltaproteobacteria bacterium]
MGKRAVILLSGGLDSATCLAMAIDQGFEPVVVSYNYDQRHRVELEAAMAIAQHYNVVEHLIFDVGMFRQIGGSALTDNIDVPKSRTLEQMTSQIPVTYVPARNTVFLSYALGVAEVYEASDLFIGVNALDYAGYPDCRPEYIHAFEAMANLAIKPGVEGQHIRVHAPLIDKTKAEIIAIGRELRVPYQLTHSCYAPSSDGVACGTCDACILRRDGFEEVGMADPTRYVSVA